VKKRIRRYKCNNCVGDGSEPTVYRAWHKGTQMIHYIPATYNAAKKVYEHKLNARKRDVMGRDNFCGSLSDLIHYAYDIKKGALNRAYRLYDKAILGNAIENLGDEYERVEEYGHGG